MKLINGHLFHAENPGGSCTQPGCGKTQSEHVESVGEWMGVEHWFLPSVRPSRCILCGKNWRHSTHFLVSPLWIQRRRGSKFD